MKIMSILFYVMYVTKWTNNNNWLEGGSVGVFGFKFHVEDGGRVTAGDHHYCCCNRGGQGHKPQHQDWDVLGKGHCLLWNILVATKNLMVSFVRFVWILKK